MTTYPTAPCAAPPWSRVTVCVWSATVRTFLPARSPNKTDAALSDVFHWDCLNARQAALPANTAPRGHQCPACSVEIFPNSNLVSPVAEALKNFLAKVNWGRNGLGLTLVSQTSSFLNCQFKSLGSSPALRGSEQWKQPDQAKAGSKSGFSQQHDQSAPHSFRRRA